jgi:hypothetical protein
LLAFPYRHPLVRAQSSISVTSSKRAIPFAPNRAPCSRSYFERPCDWFRTPRVAPARHGGDRTERPTCAALGSAFAALETKRPAPRAAAVGNPSRSAAIPSSALLPRPTSRCFRTRTENSRPLAPSWSDGRTWRPTITKLARLQQLAAGALADRINLAAITYDPAFDLPSRMWAYRLDRGVALDRQNRLLRAPHGIEPPRRYCDLHLGFGATTLEPAST